MSFILNTLLPPPRDFYEKIAMVNIFYFSEGEKYVQE